MKNIMRYQWAIIGAGPAGIAALGKLLDSGIPSQQIVWIDPEFKVGYLGTRWRNVSSNTKVKLFSKYLEESKAFNYANCPVNFELNSLEPEATCELRYIADPLQWVTDNLLKQVCPQKGVVKKLHLRDQSWQLILEDDTQLSAKNVILAIGAQAKQLNYAAVQTISLENALDRERLKDFCSAEDKVAVFGSSHSAVMAVRHLLEHPVKQVINFYRSPLRYAVYFDDWILFDNTGLKGNTATWARENIDGKLPDRLLRVFSSTENIHAYLPECTKAVYAIGFEKRILPIIEDFPDLEYNPYNGIIAPGLFGLGIAFPEASVDRYGTLEYRVGLWKFMDYLNRVLPLWLQYGN